MKSNFRRVRWLLALPPLIAISVAISADRLEVPETAMNPRQCEKWPYQVYCYEYAGHPGFGCFSSFCDATAAGFSHCTRNLKGTCK